MGSSLADRVYNTLVSRYVGEPPWLKPPPVKATEQNETPRLPYQAIIDGAVVENDKSLDDFDYKRESRKNAWDAFLTKASAVDKRRAQKEDITRKLKELLLIEDRIRKGELPTTALTPEDLALLKSNRWPPRYNIVRRRGARQQPVALSDLNMTPSQ